VSRPGLVLTVDDRTRAFAVPAGESLRSVVLPVGARVVYPPEAVATLTDPLRAVADALAAPLGSEPLAARLHPGLRLTVSVEGVTRPWPLAAAPDPRGRVVEAVLTLAAAAGVDDVAVVVATGLGRRLFPAERTALLGDRVSRSFGPLGRLTDHDAADPTGPVRVGSTDAGDDVELDRRVAESDLLVRVGVATSPGDSGPGALPRTLGSTATAVLCEDPQAAAAAGAVAVTAVPTFAVELVLEDVAAGGRAGFLATREWEWSLRDQVSARVTRGLFPRLPARVRGQAVSAVRGGRALVGIAAGDPVAVAAATAATLARQQQVPVRGQADVVVLGVPAVGPYNAGAPLNPVLAASLALDTLLGAHTGMPLVRPGGVAVLLHPLTPAFSQVQHPAHADFYADVLGSGLGGTTPPGTGPEAAGWAAARDRYATDPWYRELHSTSHAYPGIHPFLVWERTAALRAALGDVIWVGADRTAAARVGGRAATTVYDALEIASATVGRDPSITLLHSPPRLIADVS